MLCTMYSIIRTSMCYAVILSHYHSTCCIFHSPSTWIASAPTLHATWSNQGASNSPSPLGGSHPSFALYMELWISINIDGIFSRYPLDGWQTRTTPIPSRWVSALWTNNVLFFHLDGHVIHSTRNLKPGISSRCCMFDVQYIFIYHLHEKRNRPTLDGRING